MNDVNFSLNHLVSIIAIIVGLLFAFQIGSNRKGNKEGTIYFKWYLIALVFTIFLFFLIDLKLSEKWVKLAIVVSILPIILILPPLMWLYIKKLLKIEENFKQVLN